MRGLIKEKDTRDDLQAVQTAIIRLKQSDNYRSWLRKSGPIPQEKDIREKLESTIKRGLAEVELFLQADKSS